MFNLDMVRMPKEMRASSQQASLAQSRGSSYTEISMNEYLDVLEQVNS